MSQAPEFTNYLATQNGIYGKLEAVNQQVGVTEGIQRDAGTEPQSAFLVAWRHPEHIIEQVEELSFAVGSLYDAITYGRENAHTTLSDYDLAKDRLITPEDPDHAATLDLLTKAVRKGLDATDRDTIDERGISFSKAISNRTTVVAPGQPTEANWKISEAVKAASATEGLRDGAGLKGSWGNHMTLDRFLADTSAVNAEQLRELLTVTPAFGDSKPTAIDVGYFHTSPDKGFVYTTHERFDLNK